LAFFATLGAELRDLRAAGAEQIRFIGQRESALILRGGAKWNPHCDKLLGEIRAFLAAWDRGHPPGEGPLQAVELISIS